MKVKSESEVAQLCPTPSDPMDCSLPGSSVHGTFQARVLEWGAVAFSETIASASQIQVLLFGTLWNFFPEYTLEGLMVKLKPGMLQYMGVQRVRHE